MNGIDFEAFKGFEEKWKLITVRYRNDNKEMRFVYANPVAAEAMDKGVKIYPEGSIFAKVAYLAQPDPAFESSLAPSQSRRFQFMVKNNKRYKAHRGWGYALFDSQGKVNPEPVVQQINACAACHDIVPDRDYVFSWKFNQSPSQRLDLYKLKYKMVSRIKLSENLRDLLPKRYKSVLQVKSFLTKQVFQGTLDEIKPTLSKKVLSDKTPVLFVSDNNTQFTLIYPEDLDLECDDEGVKGMFLVSINSMLNGKFNKVHFCQSFK